MSGDSQPQNGFRKVLVTLGKRGCVYFNDGSVYSSPAYVEKVVDTVGAGDAVLVKGSNGIGLSRLVAALGEPARDGETN